MKRDGLGRKADGTVGPKAPAAIDARSGDGGAEGDL